MKFYKTPSGQLLVRVGTDEAPNLERLGALMEPLLRDLDEFEAVLQPDGEGLPPKLRDVAYLFLWPASAVSTFWWGTHEWEPLP